MNVERIEKIKPVRAWAVLDADGQIAISEYGSRVKLFTDKSEARSFYSRHQLLRVEIRVVPQKRRKARRKDK